MFLDTIFTASIFHGMCVPDKLRLKSSITFLLLFFWGITIPCKAQTATDSLANDFRSVVAKNFSRYRTVNLYWEMKGSHHYTFASGGTEMEKARKRDLHTIRFSTMIPVVKKKRFSLYGNLQYSNYHFQIQGEPSDIFGQDDYSHYQGGLSASYFASLLGRPFLLSADVSVDGWNEGWGKLQGRFVAAMIFKRENKTGISVGLAAMTLGKIPVMPVFSYWHRFDNPDWSVDITLPSQLYLRYQIKNQRISVGSSMTGDNFYLHTDLSELPSVCYYSEVVIKPEVLYEYIINKHFYLSARTGISVPLKSGLYTKGRKEIKLTGEHLEQDRLLIPFFHVGISYSLFR